MIVNNFADDYLMFENMSIWEIKSLDDFFSSHESLKEIFEKEYGFSFEKIKEQEAFKDSDKIVVSKLLDYFGDKHFFIFANNDTNHNELKKLQDKKVINFGMDIHVIHPTKTYVLEMDKTKDLKMYDR
ncbi:MAG: hypothetical protein IT239_00770 [Bacteroidia bacterium]|nr:hypothetical protein [Bacteroidia bacterium]